MKITKILYLVLFTSDRKHRSTYYLPSVYNTIYVLIVSSLYICIRGFLIYYLTSNKNKNLFLPFFFFNTNNNKCKNIKTIFIIQTVHIIKDTSHVR